MRVHVKVPASAVLWVIRPAGARQRKGDHNASGEPPLPGIRGGSARISRRCEARDATPTQPRVALTGIPALSFVWVVQMCAAGHATSLERFDA
jgi:hypothetical protein